MKLFLLDDNKSITDMFSKYLSMKGHECTVSNDPKSGFEIMKNGNFDIILLDLAMPELSGIDIIENLVKEGKINDYKIIVISASSISDLEVKKLISDGIRKCLKKPVQLSELNQAIMSV